MASLRLLDNVNLSFVSGEPGTKNGSSQEYKANFVRKTAILRSTRRTWYEKRIFSGVQGEPGTKNLVFIEM
ncbi:MAG: hypothetical protein DRR19_05955 [Candidatus Parabeggiatoa sp. nov. 1]|nr:MAG: hypothetical protein DRR19_05955 [Gammaproteobacteria bacterium]